MSFPLTTETLLKKFKKNFTSKNEYYVTGLLSNDSQVLNEIYDLYLPSVHKFVTDNNGTNNDALDVFQDALIVIFKKLKNSELVLTGNFHCYLFAVCRFTWLRELKKKHRSTTEHNLKNFPFISDIDIEKEYNEHEKQKLFNSKLFELAADSREVLQLFFNQKSLKEIAGIMGYSIAYAKKKKYKAKEMLVKAIKQDARFNQMR